MHPLAAERYDRQIRLKGFGEEGQRKLAAARVLVVGAGGLGCPALQYLAAAGVGTLGIVDNDRVSMSNLHRQILYGMEDIGASKAHKATDRLRKLNPEISLDPHDERLDRAAALRLFPDYDIILDGTDDFPTRYLIGDACALLGKPLVYGAVSQYEGQVALFNAPDAGGRRVHYRDLFPDPPGPDEAPNCAEAGVLGVLPGLIGLWQAAEVIKWITGIGESLAGKLLTYDIRTNETRIFQLKAAAGHDAMPSSPEEFLAQGEAETALNDDLEIDAAQFSHWLKTGLARAIDIREPGEMPVIDHFPHAQHPFSRFAADPPEIMGATVLFCRTGKRSRQAAQSLRRQHGDVPVHSLKGGISAWQVRMETDSKEEKAES